MKKKTLMHDGAQTKSLSICIISQCRCHFANHASVAYQNTANSGTPETLWQSIPVEFYTTLLDMDSHACTCVP